MKFLFLNLTNNFQSSILIFSAYFVLLGCTSKANYYRSPSSDSIYFNNEGQKILDPKNTDEAVVYLNEYIKTKLNKHQKVLNTRLLETLERHSGQNYKNAEFYLNSPLGLQQSQLIKRFSIRIGDACFWAEDEAGRFFRRALEGEQVRQMEKQIDILVLFLSDYIEKTLAQPSSLDPSIVEICTHKTMRESSAFDGTTLRLGIRFDRISRDYKVLSLEQIRNLWKNGDFTKQWPGAERAQVAWQILNPTGMVRIQIRELLYQNGFKIHEQFQKYLERQWNSREPQSLETPKIEAFARYLDYLGFSSEELMQFENQVHAENINEILSQVNKALLDPQNQEALMMTAVARLSEEPTDVSIKVKQKSIIGFNLANYHHIDIAVLLANSNDPDFSVEIKTSERETLSYDVSQFSFIGFNVNTPDFVKVGLDVILKQIQDPKILARGVVRKVMRDYN